MKKIKVFTAFSGYDSQCMALDRLCCEHRDLEYELVGWSEIEPHAIASHNVAFPEYAHRNYGDISKVDWNAVDSFELFTYSSPQVIVPVVKPLSATSLLQNSSNGQSKVMSRKLICFCA